MRRPRPHESPPHSIVTRTASAPQHLHRGGLEGTIGTVACVVHQDIYRAESLNRARNGGVDRIRAECVECNNGRGIAGEVSFRYDPDDPVPTRGGSGMLAYNLRGYDGAPPVTVEQSGLCERDDVLTFRSDAIPEGMLISGTVSVTLEVASSAPDTAFTAKLIEVSPDGRSFNIRDSITSLAYQNGSEVPQEYRPGERVSVTMDFWPIAWRVQPASHLRLDVSSSDFPKFHAHTNRAGPWADQTGIDVADQVVFGGRVEVPVESAQ